MATRTRAELVNAALGKLGVIASGQAAEAEDTDKVNAKVGPLFAQLATDKICEVDADEIQDALFEPLAALLANTSAQDFSIPYSEDVKTTFERQLVRLTAARPTRETLAVDYF